MNYSDKKILYLFGEGRIKRLNYQNNSSDEFFYGFNTVKKHFQNTEIIEMNPNYQKPIMNLIDKVLRKISNLPFYLSHIITFKNQKKIFNSDVILATSDRVGVSAVLLVLISKLFRKKKFLVVVMGMLSKYDKRTKNILDRLFISTFIRSVDHFFFLGKPEAKKAEEIFPLYKEKFHFLPFCINEKFWESKENIKIKDKEYIAFIGNDGNREYNLAIDIAKSLPEQKFIFVTQNINSDDIPENVTMINGSWNDETISDAEIREIYEKSRITIVPLKNSIQPSGQSVTLQSLSVGTPVIITKTEGFWDESKYINNENIIFLYDNSLENWTKKIENIYNNEKLLNNISIKGSQLVKKEYKQVNFDKNLISFLN